jgi:histone H1/5
MPPSARTRSRKKTPAKKSAAKKPVAKKAAAKKPAAKKAAARKSVTHSTTRVTIGPAVEIHPRAMPESAFAPIDFEARQERMRVKRRHPGLGGGAESAKPRSKPSDVPPTTVKP